MRKTLHTMSKNDNEISLKLVKSSKFGFEFCPYLLLRCSVFMATFMVIKHSKQPIHRRMRNVQINYG